MPNCQYCGEHDPYSNWCANCYDNAFLLCVSCEQTYHPYDLIRLSKGKYVCYYCIHWKETAVRVSHPTIIKIGSKRCFGVELETSECPRHFQLKGNTCFGVKEDGSIGGLEFVSPILQGDEGLAEVRKFCKLAHKNKFKVDNECGFHLHIDLRNTTGLQRRKIAYAYRLTLDNFWVNIVDPDRLSNEFCELPNYSASDIQEARGFESFVRNWANYRYQFINWQAYHKYKTVEIRGFQGTLHAPTICNWISAHLRFVDFVQNKTWTRLNNLFNNGQSALKRGIRKALGSRLAKYYSRHLTSAECMV